MRSASSVPDDIPLDHPDLEMRLERPDRPFKERGLAGAGCAHKIYNIHPCILEPFPILLGDAVIRFEYAGNDLDLH